MFLLIDNVSAKTESVTSVSSGGLSSIVRSVENGISNVGQMVGGFFIGTAQGIKNTAEKISNKVSKSLFNEKNKKE